MTDSVLATLVPSSNYNSRRWWWWDLPSFSQRPPLISLWRTTPSITTTATASSSSQQQDIAADITIGIDSSSSSISPSFGRLKAQKVKALVHRSKQHRNRSTDRPRDSSPNPRSRGGWGDVIGSFHSLNSQELAPDTSFFSVKSFRELGCADYLIQSLQKLSFLRPSNAMAFAPVIAGKTCIIADQSGSGKTLAYLAPIIRRLRQEELEGQCKSSAQAPRVVILAPTAELASQVACNKELNWKLYNRVLIYTWPFFVPFEGRHLAVNKSKMKNRSQE
ncbi:hypothetical protein Ahy_A07g036813 isoform B [Arachis hypogaea]|uniref:Helicase ATP-binding domain-containing protein n=1 Tax=Arachis hypogaea TaxID=3818 RepID=A0A445CH27_ARAHY|nr:hypothetical protein Ahy_A07g036813 isoform B [Arachis hypogaea]